MEESLLGTDKSDNTSLQKRNCGDTIQLSRRNCNSLNNWIAFSEARLLWGLAFFVAFLGCQKCQYVDQAFLI